MTPLDWLPVIAAGLMPLIVGSLWYHPSIFGTRWMSLKHITPEIAERSARFETRTTVIMIVLGISAALMLRLVLASFDVASAMDAIFTGFGLWLGFVVPPTIHRVLWDHIPLNLYLIESGQWLVSLCLMAVVLLY